MNNTSGIANGSDIDEGGFADCPLSEDSQLEIGLKSAAILAVLVLSLVGNSFIIRVIHRNRRLRKVAHYLIANLAVADLLITLMLMPEAAKVEITGTNQWFSGSFALVLCKLLPFCQTVSVSCSIFTLVAISLDKYVTIVYPLKRIMTIKRLRLVIPLIWFASAVTASPQLIANNLVHDPDGSVWCLEEWPSPFDPTLAPRDYTIVYLAILYLLPLCVILVLYSKVFYVISRRRIPGNRTAATIRSQQKSRQKAGKMIVAVIVCFALCWLPEHISFFLLYFVPAYSICGPPDVVWFLSRFFSFANSALNPWICFLLNRNYRNGLKGILRCEKHPSLASDISRSTVRREGVSESSQINLCTQEISRGVASLEVLNFTNLSRARFSGREQGTVNLVHFRSLHQD